jgi:hypothetical protein
MAEKTLKKEPSIKQLASSAHVRTRADIKRRLERVDAAYQDLEAVQSRPMAVVAPRIYAVLAAQSDLLAALVREVAP